MFGIISCHAGSSSLRYKAFITSYRSGVVNRLQPIAFSWKADGIEARSAGNVETLLVTHNDRGEAERVRYDRVAVVLIKTVNGRQTQIQPRKRVRRRTRS